MDSHYVPIEDRWFGLDKRAIPYALVMIVLVAVLAYVIPAINDAVGWDDETRAGDVLDLGGGVTVVPPVGWQLEAGIRTSNEPATPVNPAQSDAEIVNGGVTIVVAASLWDGTADALLDQANTLREDSGADDDKLFNVTGSRTTETTSSGISGVSEAFSSATGDGKLFAFVLPAAGQGGGEQVGVVITATGSGDNLSAYDDAINTMVSTLTRSEDAS